MTAIVQSSHVAAEAFEARRRRRLRLFVLAVLGYVAAMLLMIGGWHWYSSARLASAIGQIRAAGDPVTPDEFNPTADLPAAENAAVTYESAIAAIDAPTQFRDPQGNLADAVEIARNQLREHGDSALAERIVDRNGKALSLWRSARQLDETDWGVRFSSPMINVLLPQLSGQRRLAKLGVAAGSVAAKRGDHAELVQIALDLAHLARRIDEPRTSVVISHMVAIAVHSLLAETLLEPLIPNLSVAPVGPGASTRSSDTADVPQGGAAGRSARPAPRDAVLELIRELYDDAPIRKGWQRAMTAERASMLDTVRGFLDGTTPGAILGVPGSMGISARLVRSVTRATFQLDGVRMLRNATLMLRAGLAASFPEAQRFVAEIESSAGATVNVPFTQQASRILSRILEPAYDRSLSLSFRIRAMRRMAATALAIRLFELDHGTRPASLAELVPEYLPDPPRDPFAPNDEPLGYVPAGPRPRVYSRGEDGRDDGGKFGYRESGLVDPDRLDLVYFLDGQRPTNEPAYRPPSP